MTKSTQYFEHESLQDTQAILNYLTALTEGIKKGEVLFSDTEETLVLRPNKVGLLKIRAKQTKKSQELRIKLNWIINDASATNDTPLFIESKTPKTKASKKSKASKTSSPAKHIEP